MAPCRQLLMWSVPSIAVLLGIFWFKKKREYAKSDPGGRERLKSLKEELAEVLNAQAEANRGSPISKLEHSIIKSSPIDIIPNGTNSQRSSPLELTDEEIDLEIEKIIRIKSIGKEKRMSAGFDKQNLIVSSCTTEPSFVVKELQNNLCSHVQLQQSSPKNSEMHIIDSNHSFSSNVNSNKDLLDSEAECYKKNSTNNGTETFVSEGDTIENTSEGTEGLQPLDVVDEPCNTGDNNDRFSTSQRRLLSERDSANHSPVDPLLASPSMCNFSDNHSEGSSDSGKGCSEAASPPPASLNIVPTETDLRIHQFVLSQNLVGLLIGKHGSFVTQIKAKTGASVYVRRHPESSKQKICAVEGTQSEIEAALDMIKEKFPEKKFPNFSLQEISAELYQKLTPLIPEFLQLVESVNNDTILTCLVSAGHFFLQQPLHPTFPSLHVLHRLMAATYQNPDVPSLPRPVKEGAICAAPTENNWYRAQVISTSEENDTSVVKLVDFGGYLTVDNDQLKQIRSDFMTLPFQATEALLAFVKPANNVEWSGEALRIMAGLTAGQLLHAQVAGYDETGLPLVHLYLTLHPQQVIFLNRELVERGLAEWDVPPDS
ncbi:A-kinase anchor protein 1, mitochondrial isoform X3 [Bombyx mandarina]|uniref:Tudor domain-containing protein n=2 Tax=Bombyx TaxID=7090 RepID=A0A8R2ALY6_BOMMO|nr:A-kinase anchor protein 1, mitochondrial isoform X3 [Bombyx mori]XP_028029037.1 A-kinase anchor protein 1, mitochondrial isoform X3 [Bombyx mandarina]